MKEDRNKVHNCPNLRFLEFEGEWKIYKVSDLLEFFTTNSLSWEQLEYDTENIYNLHYGLIHNGAPTLINTNDYILPNICKEFTPKTYTLCQDGDVAFADASEDTNDVAKVIEFFNCNDKKIVCGLHTIHGRDKLNITVNGFKGYAFSSFPFHNQIRRLAQGTKVYSVSQKNFSESFIGIPSKEEQLKIAGLLRLIDDRISTQSQTIQGLESLIKGLNNYIFEAVKSNTKQVFFSELYKTAKEGGTPDTKNAEYYEEGEIPFVKIDDLKNKYLENNQWFITEKGLHNSSAWLVPSNSIIYSNGATIGSISINKYPVATKQGILGIVIKDNVSLEYVFYFMSSKYFRREIGKITTHGTMKTAYIKDIDTIKCYLPEYETQVSIVKILNVLTSKIETEQKLLLTCQKQKQYLLKQMFI